MNWLLLAIAAASLLWLRSDRPRFKYGEVIRVPGTEHASLAQVEAHAQSLRLAPDEYETISLGYAMGKPNVAIRITRGYA